MSQSVDAVSARTRWTALVLPGALAVMLGVLGADLMKLVIRALVAGERQPTAAIVAAPPAGVRPAPVDEANEDDTVVVQVGTPLAGNLPSLPGPSSARRDGDARACINGTVVFRRSNGWEQGLQDDAPVRCRAGSP